MVDARIWGDQVELIRRDGVSGHEKIRYQIDMANWAFVFMCSSRTLAASLQPLR